MTLQGEYHPSENERVSHIKTLPFGKLCGVSLQITPLKSAHVPYANSSIVRKMISCSVPLSYTSLKLLLPALTTCAVCVRQHEDHTCCIVGIETSSPKTNSPGDSKAFFTGSSVLAPLHILRRTENCSMSSFCCCPADMLEAHPTL